MKRILIGYGSNSGSTHFASHILADTLREQSQIHDIDVKEIKDVVPHHLREYDLVIFGTNTWFYNNAQGQPHIWYFDFEKEFVKHTYPHTQFAVLALGDSSYIEFCESAEYLKKMISKAGAEKNIIIDSLRIDGYYRDEKHNNALIEEWAKKILAVLH